MSKSVRTVDADHISLGDGRDSGESDGIINFISQSSRFFDLLTFDDFDLPRLNSPRLDFGQKQSEQLGKTNATSCQIIVLWILF